MSSITIIPPPEVIEWLTSLNLGNIILETTMPTQKGDNEMGRQKVHVTLPNGEKVWITGKNNDELISNALTKYGSGNDLDQRKTVRFDAYANEVFDAFLIKRWKDTTAKSNRFLMDKHILPYFGDMEIGKITTVVIQKFFDQKTDLSKSYTGQMKILLHQIFQNAIEDELIKKDPTESKRLVLPERVTKRAALQTAQFRSIITNLNKLKQEDALLLALLCFTGMRRGEVLGLKWENVMEDIILVRSETVFQGNQPIYHDYTKSNAGMRELQIMPDLKPYFNKRGTGFVIGGGDTPITQSKFDRTWQRIGKTIDLYGATPHIIRHTFATELLASGADPKTVQVWMGHADFSFTMNTYVHKSDENMIKAVTRMSDHINLTHELTPNEVPETLTA